MHTGQGDLAFGPSSYTGPSLPQNAVGLLWILDFI